MMDERKRTSDLFGSDNSPAVLCQLVVVAFQPLLGSFQVKKGGGVRRVALRCDGRLAADCGVIL